MLLDSKSNGFSYQNSDSTSNYSSADDATANAKSYDSKTDTTANAWAYSSSNSPTNASNDF